VSNAFRALFSILLGVSFGAARAGIEWEVEQRSLRFVQASQPGCAIIYALTALPGTISSKHMTSGSCSQVSIRLLRAFRHQRGAPSALGQGTAHQHKAAPARSPSPSRFRLPEIVTALLQMPASRSHYRSKRLRRPVPFIESAWSSSGSKWN
jgi:hypothetical protein